jgi:hypothetical protein
MASAGNKNKKHVSDRALFAALNQRRNHPATDPPKVILAAKKVSKEQAICQSNYQKPGP